MGKGDRALEVARIVNTFDQEGKTPLFYAWYNINNFTILLFFY